MNNSNITYGVYSIYDKAAAVFGQPFTSINDDTASRQFGYAFSDQNSIYHFAPSDYELHKIADFCVDGSIVPVDKYIVCRGTDYVV